MMFRVSSNIRRLSSGGHETTFFTICPHTRTRRIAARTYNHLLGWSRCFCLLLAPKCHLLLLTYRRSVSSLTPFFRVNPGLAGYIGAKDDGSDGDNWSYKRCKAPVKLPPPTNQHPSFYESDPLPVAQPTASKHRRKTRTDAQFYILVLENDC